MRRTLIGLATALAAVAAAAPAWAALPVGARAPDFTTTGALAGRPFHLHLASELKKGPVVLYFYPKAFTSGCTMEAHAFSDAATDFKKAGAEIIGMSADDLPALKKFSVEGCRKAFPVAIASPATIKAYDVALSIPNKPATGMTNRTSYVIGRDGRVAMVHSDLDWSQHVAKTLSAVRALKR